MFFDFAILAWKRLFRPPKLGFGGFDPLNGESYQRHPQKAHPWAERRHMTYRSSKSVHRWDLCAWRRDQKKKQRQRQKPDSGKLAIRRDRLRRRIEMKSCMVGGLQVVVLSFELYQNRLSGFGAVGVEICPSPLTWPLAYTTACFMYKPWSLVSANSNTTASATVVPASASAYCDVCLDAECQSCLSTVWTCNVLSAVHWHTRRNEFSLSRVLWCNIFCCPVL